ncbi:MAG: ribonuclease III [Acidobacteria bacterium]|jgi:ribonuclease-3|nr:MAG: ribonuclease III [Acidobacteriota bacterium]GIU81706.1 MAG: ribonuclease 3 [Pyrinomonadaceae bacterium]
MPSSDLVILEREIGHQFRDRELLKRALTHRSWAYENAPTREDENKIRKLHNESLEFVGDAVLNLAIVEILYHKFPECSEGELTLMKHFLVSASTIAKVAQKIKLGDYIIIGRGEEKTGGRAKRTLLADSFEALTGAIFLDAGYIKAKSFVEKMFADELKEITPESALDYKTLLQEILQAQKKEAPRYRVIEKLGPPHKPTFFVEVEWDGGKAVGKGCSIKQAETAAASLALEKIRNESAF